MKTIRQLRTVLLTLFITSFGLAQNINFTTEPSAKKVGVTDRFQVTYSCNKSGNFILPNFKHFINVGSVSRGSNTSIEMINGQVTQKVTHSYTLVLKPKKIGTYKLEGAKIKVGNATYESKPVTIEVVKESQARQRTRGQNPFDRLEEMMRGTQRSQSQNVEITDKDFFGRIAVSKSKPYKNESFLITYKLYAKNFNFGLESYDFPTQENFWSENIKIPEESKPIIETFEGVKYRVFTLKKEILFPQKSGKLVLNPFELTARIQTSIFSPTISKKIRSNAPIIEAKELPVNAPESFVNQVGQFSMETNIVSDSVIVDQPIDYKIIVSGKGNLKQLSNFKINFPEELELYDPEVKNNIKVNNAGVSGKKTYNYLLIPRKSGIYTIPSIEFTYFDLQSKSYKTITSKEYKIKVYTEEGKLEDNIVSSITDDKENIEISEEVGGSDWTWLYILLPSLLLGGGTLYYLIFKRQTKEETEEERRRNARKKLAMKMALAKAHLDDNNIGSFYDETLIGLNKYVNEKLQIQTANMTKENIEEVLSIKGVEQNTIKSFIHVLEQCEMAKYAPLSPQNNVEIYEKSVDVIEQIERVIK